MIIEVCMNCFVYALNLVLLANWLLVNPTSAFPAKHSMIAQLQKRMFPAPSPMTAAAAHLHLLLLFVHLLFKVNIIPKWVNFTVDVRSKQQEFRQRVVDSIRASVAAMCDRRGAQCTITCTHDAPPVRA
jgi:acetylornithine deacetylase/succinyl-diaminopimelate desuccinylase-like protein